MKSANDLALPVVVYLLVTVVAPGINGGFLRADFWTHAAWVTLWCAVVVGAIGLARLMVRRPGRP